MRIVRSIRKCVFFDYCSLHFVCHRSESLIRSKEVKDVLIETYCHLVFMPVIFMHMHSLYLNDKTGATKWHIVNSSFRIETYSLVFVFIIEKQIEMDEDPRLESVCSLVVPLSSLKHYNGKVSNYLWRNVSLNAMASRFLNTEKQSNFQITNGCCFPCYCWWWWCFWYA